MGKITETTTNLEYNELHKCKVTPSGTGSHISFIKKLTGRVVYVLTPKIELAYWGLELNKIDTLYSLAEKEKFSGTWSGNLKHLLLSAIEDIKNSPDEFELKNLYTIVGHLSSTSNKQLKGIIEEIKMFYSI